MNRVGPSRDLERTHYCGMLTTADVDRPVTIMGWVDRRRDLGGHRFYFGIQRVNNLGLVVKRGLSGFCIITGGKKVPGMVTQRRICRDLLSIDTKFRAAILVDEEAVTFILVPLRD